MDTVSFVATNTLEGVIGGASSIIPVVSVSFMLRYLFLKIYGNYGIVISTNDTTTLFNVLSIISGIVSGITGGVMADNYISSIYNGAQYGLLSYTVIFILLTLLFELTDPRNRWRYSGIPGVSLIAGTVVLIGIGSTLIT